MSFDLIDTFSGTAGTLLTADTPDVGSAWSSSSSYQYPGSALKLTGNGRVYNSLSSGSSLNTSPAALTGSVHQVRASFVFLSDIGSSSTYGIALYSGASPVDQRFYWCNGNWVLSGCVTSVLDSAYAFPTTGTVIEARLTCTDGSPQTVLAEVSADAGQTWSTLFGGVQSVATGNTNPLTPGIWYDVPNSPTTGVLIGNFRVEQTAVSPTLALSPTTATVGTPLTITLTGTGTAWQPGTPGVPTFTVSGGTGASLSSQVVSGVHAATVSLNPGSVAGTLTIHDPSGGTATVTASAATATAFTLTGPSSGYINTASTNFTVTPNGIETGTFTPTAVSGVTFTPSTLTWSGDASAKTFTITKATAGSASINGTFSNSITPPSPVSYTFNSPTLTVSPPTGSATDASTTLAITATLAGSSASLSATLVGSGTLSTASPVSGTPFTYTPPSSGSGTATITVTEATDSLSATCVVTYAVATIPNYLTSVSGFTQGMVGGTTSGFGYRTSVNGGAYDSSLQTSGITEDIPGTYSAFPSKAAGSLLKVKWYDPTAGITVLDADVALVSSDTALAALLDPLYGYPTATAGASTTITLDPSTGSDIVGQTVAILGGTGIDQARRITAYNTGTHVATVDHAWTTTPDTTSVYALYATQPGPVTLDLTQAGITPRALDSVADSALTVGDALACAMATAAGKANITGTSYVVKSPSTGTVIRTLTLDSATSPTSRS